MAEHTEMKPNGGTEAFVQYGLKMKPTLFNIDFTSLCVTNNLGEVLFDKKLYLHDSCDWGYLRHGSPMTPRVWRYQYLHRKIVNNEIIISDTVTFLVNKNTEEITEISIVKEDTCQNYIRLNNGPTIEYSIDTWSYRDYEATIKFT